MIVIFINSVNYRIHVNLINYHVTIFIFSYIHYMVDVINPPHFLFTIHNFTIMATYLELVVYTFQITTIHTKFVVLIMYFLVVYTYKVLLKRYSVSEIILQNFFLPCLFTGHHVLYNQHNPFKDFNIFYISSLRIISSSKKSHIKPKAVFLCLLFLQTCNMFLL